jgi:riboflavin transporter FmnP
MDFSELPALIAAFSLGPVWGAAVCLIKNLLHLIVTTTGGVGELANFILGAVFTFSAGFIYKKNKNIKGALLASIIGSALMALVSLPVNYFITYPFYSNFMPMDAILGMYKAILPSADTLFKALLIFNVPFNFVFKGIVNSLITFLVYKRLSPIIKGR